MNQKQIQIPILSLVLLLGGFIPTSSQAETSGGDGRAPTETPNATRGPCLEQPIALSPQSEPLNLEDEDCVAATPIQTTEALPTLWVYVPADSQGLPSELVIQHNQQLVGDPVTLPALCEPGIVAIPISVELATGESYVWNLEILETTGTGRSGNPRVSGEIERLNGNDSVAWLDQLTNVASAQLANPSEQTQAEWQAFLTEAQLEAIAQQPFGAFCAESR